ncbi:L-rhamnose isomerase [subsurface metagenome]
MTQNRDTKSAYSIAKQRYAEYGVDTDKALEILAGIAISLHCWQGDDVGGFETNGGLSGGIVATGNYPGKARTPNELQSDLVKALSLLPGKHRLSLHASYLEASGKKVERNEIRPEHYSGWIDWAREQGIGMDFNHTFFRIRRPKVASPFQVTTRTYESSG